MMARHNLGSMAGVWGVMEESSAEPGHSPELCRNGKGKEGSDKAFLMNSNSNFFLFLNHWLILFKRHSVILMGINSQQLFIV